MIPADELKRDILRRYNRDPHEWHVFVGNDQKGYYDVVVVHGSDAWLIKEQPINPLQSIGFGVRDNILDQDVVKRLTEHTFGLRPLSEPDVARVAQALKRGRSLSRIINRVLRTEPVAFKELESPMALQGPIIRSPALIDTISENQTELNRKLRIELEKQLYRRYPQSIAPYL
jgi:hypothetical protein